MGILLLYSVQLDDIFSLGPFILEKVIPVCQKKIFRQVYEPSYENSMKRYLIRLYQTKRFPLYRDIACWSVHRKIFVPYERNLFDTFSLSRKIIYNNSTISWPDGRHIMAYNIIIINYSITIASTCQFACN